MAISVAPQLASTSTVDVIVRGADVAAVSAAVAHHGGEVELEIGLIDAVSATIPTNLLTALRSDARVTDITSDAAVSLSGVDLSGNHRGSTSDEAIQALGGNDMLYSTRMDGDGIDVAVVDSGITATSALPESRIMRGVDVSFDKNTGTDGYGHGTAMAGIIGGRGSKFQGSAANARIIDVKVADANGMADISQVLAGIDWVVSNRNTDGRNIRVMSLSFGTDGTNAYDTSPLAYAVEAAWRHGIVVVVAAGNHGDSLGRLASPAIDPFVIAVGAADTSTVYSYNSMKNATVPSWSARGNGVRNPDIVAPGRSMLGGRADGSKIATDNPQAWEGDYLLGSGTSQATAFTAGIVASVLEARPSLTPDQVKALLVRTARDIPAAPATKDGAGLIDLGKLFPKGQLIATPTKITQNHGWSTGSGSLDGDRGRFILEKADGTKLTGENTVVGTFDRNAWQKSTWTGSTWTGSTWTGSTWTGSTWTGSTWTGSTWTGSTWTGSTWTGSTWTNVMWGE